MKQEDSRALLLLLAGFTVWSAAFVILYGLQALGCAFGWGEWHRPIFIVSYVLSLLPLAWLAWPRPRAGSPTTPLTVSAVWANCAAPGAGILVFFPVNFVSTCI
jgi:hypothetical protein